MPTPKTPEAKAGQEALTEAIQKIIQAYGWEDCGVLGDYIIITAQIKFNDDGDPVTEYNLLFRDGASQPHIAIGLLQSGLSILATGWESNES